MTELKKDVRVEALDRVRDTITSVSEMIYNDQDSWSLDRARIELASAVGMVNFVMASLIESPGGEREKLPF